MKNLLRIGVACALASTSFAQVYQYCAQPDICYGFNVPSASASSGSGDIYFQLQAPSSQQWFALGQGNQMAGANIFIVYADASGTNVTLSPRLGLGHFQPNYDTAAQVTLLEGSGIANGKMTANIRCANCASWSGGTMSFTDTAATWIWSERTGDSISSDSPSADLQKHDTMGAFTVDMTKATGGNSLNPFVIAATGTNSSSTPEPTVIATGGAYTSSTESTRHTRVVTHGILMSSALLIFFPFGALTIRLLSFKGLVWVHAGLQLFAYTVAITGMGIGVWLAVTQGAFQTSAHPIIGLVVVCLLVFQPILGLTHHFVFRRTDRRTFWATAHIWYGRTLLLLGAINGGLGLQLAGNTVNGEIAYGVIAGVVFLIYVSVVVISSIRGRGKREGETGEKMLRTSPAYSDEGFNRRGHEP